MVLARELDVRETLLDVAHHRAEVPPLHVRAHVDPARLQLPLDVIRGRRDVDLGDLLQAHATAVGRVDRKPLYVGEAVARRRDAPDVDVVGLAALEDVAHLFACQQG